MERLPPLARAVYVLREAFSHSHAEIAEILTITESASQQHLHRARSRITRLVVLRTDDASAISDGAGLTEKLLQYDNPQASPPSHGPASNQQPRNGASLATL
ncbi:sigma factor-like helix-turn-helix DNA-binding protein [Streptomyces smyrnaeus]